MAGRSAACAFLVLLAGCFCEDDHEVVRYDDAGRVVARWSGVSRWQVEGGCIVFERDCDAGYLGSDAQVECGNVAVLPTSR